MEQFQPYEGGEPYIFVSYARKDKSRVLPFLKALQQAGYRIWYDAGIQPGEIWAEVIATHIKKCKVCLAFISAHSVDSEHCKEEIRYARQKRKTLVPFFLENDVSLSDGMEMIFTAIQVLRLSECPSPQDLPNRLANQEKFRACKAAAARREDPVSPRRSRTRDSAPESAVVPTLAPVTAADSGTKKTRKPSPWIRAVYVNGRLVFSGETAPKKPFMSEVLRLTLEAVLNDYLGDGSALNKRGVVEAFIRTHPIFLRFEAVSSAQFAAKKTLDLNGFSSPVYLATNNDTQTKWKYVTQLCDFLKAAGQICDIQWLATDDNASWSWGGTTGEIPLLNHAIAMEAPPDGRL